MSDLVHRVRAALSRLGAATGPELQDLCGVSRSSVARALGALAAAGEVLRVGRGRSPVYAMPRRIEGLAFGAIPIFQVGRDGQVRDFGTLVPTRGGRCWVEEFDEPLVQLHDGLPWFLADVRPQGFLGRAFAHAHRELGLAENPDHWNDDDILRALCLAGEDLPGNLIVGTAARDRYLRALPPARVAPGQYAELAAAAMRGALPGSSAGGEQPKFCAVRDDGLPVIVKFSSAGTAPADVRWADLLVCEHLALTTLREAGIPAAVSRVFRAGGRMLLEVERFDRTREGRVGMVSLLGFDSEYIGHIDNWGAAAERIAERRLLRESQAQRLRLLEAFGRQIGNTDRHYGNISLLIDSEGRWEVAPAYDMLPMIYAPVAGEIVPREDFRPAALVSAAETREVWPAARELAARFWARAAAETEISPAFRQELRRHADAFAAGEPRDRGAGEDPAFQRSRTS